MAERLVRTSKYGIYSIVPYSALLNKFVVGFLRLSVFVCMRMCLSEIHEPCVFVSLMRVCMRLCV